MNTNEVFYFLMNHACIYCDNCGNELIYHDIRIIVQACSKIQILL